ncbi:hypothetical protein [Streptomyces collinus]
MASAVDPAIAGSSFQQRGHQPPRQSAVDQLGKDYDAYAAAVVQALES